MAGTSNNVNSLRNRNRLIVGCPKDGESNYSTTTGIDTSSADWGDGNIVMVGLLLTDNAGADASGDIAVEMENGGEMTIPFSVSADDSREVMRGYRIKKVLSDGTTYDGGIFPLL